MEKTIDPKLIGKRLRELRGIRTKAGVARELGISYSAMCQYEYGLRVPRDDIKLKFARYYEVPVESIFFTENIPQTI